MIVDVVVRCRNEMPYTARTLAALRAQEGVEARVLFIDCHSSDGSREAAIAHGVQLHELAPEAYVPGRVLNFGMRRTASDVVAFVNADAVPLASDALARLVAPLSDSKIAAAYARQQARPEADALSRADYARAFADEPPRVRHGAFFSMAASAIRRDAWASQPFDETLRFSEDVAWTERLRARGLLVQYVPESRFEHSHAYSLKGQFRRHAGEGAADTLIHSLSAPSPWSDLVRPLAGALLRDLRGGVLGPSAVLTRVAQASGRFAGRSRAARSPSDPWPRR